MCWWRVGPPLHWKPCPFTWASHRDCSWPDLCGARSGGSTLNRAPGSLGRPQSCDPTKFTDLITGGQWLVCWWRVGPPLHCDPMKFPHFWWCAPCHPSQRVGPPLTCLKNETNSIYPPYFSFFNLSYFVCRDSFQLNLTWYYSRVYVSSNVVWFLSGCRLK